MHYRNGREAKNGDRVVLLTTEGGKIVGHGVLYDARPEGGDHCNGYIAQVGAAGYGSPIASNPLTACLCDCLHVDDLAALLAEKGLDKRPPGK